MFLTLYSKVRCDSFYRDNGCHTGDQVTKDAVVHTVGFFTTDEDGAMSTDWDELSGGKVLL